MKVQKVGIVGAGNMGCGIAQKDKAVIFDRYYTSKDTGTGLGLAVVERSVSAHSGRIEVKSEKGVWGPGL